MANNQSQKASVFLIPVPLVTDGLHTLPEELKQKAIRIQYYFVENLRSARRFLKQISKEVDIDNITFMEMGENNPPDLHILKKWIEAGYEIGVLSEAGCPGIADPGKEIVKRAHELGATVKPFVGPNSIILALMSSGFSGQQFRFVGYLPVKDKFRKTAIQELELASDRNIETQIFIETPYRNISMFEDLKRFCRPQTRLCIASMVTDSDFEWIQSKTIEEWSKSPTPDINKRPSVFLLYTH